MDSQEGIDEVYTLDYFDWTKIDRDINSQSKKRSPTLTYAGIFQYSNAYQARIKAENPDAKFTEIPGIASSEFKSLSDKEASKWHS
jgi:hypothetical protein